MPSKRIYNCIYWYCGGTARGRWLRADPSQRAYIERMGYVVRNGDTDIGPPETPPSAEELDQAVRFKPTDDGS